MRSSSPGASRPCDGTAQPIDAAWAHRDELVLYARRLLGARGDLAEDVVQEAFLRLHEHEASDSAIRESRPWLFRVTRNLALDERRRGRRGEDVQTSLEVVAARPRGPLEVLQGREEARQALEGLGALPPREQRTVILDQAGLPPTAIARRMQTTTNAVHQSLFRARRRMRDARAAAWGLLPLPIIRLVLRAASSPALDKLPAVAPGSGGRLAGGTSLAGLVAAAVIGGGVVADHAVVPHPGHVRGSVSLVAPPASTPSPAHEASVGAAVPSATRPSPRPPAGGDIPARRARARCATRSHAGARARAGRRLVPAAGGGRSPSARARGGARERDGTSPRGLRRAEQLLRQPGALGWWRPDGAGARGARDPDDPRVGRAARSPGGPRAPRGP